MNIIKSNSKLNYERIAGKLDAAMVFAAAASEAYQVGNRGFGDVCYADAREEYTSSIELVAGARLTVRHRTSVEMNLNVLRRLLDRLHCANVKAA